MKLFITMMALTGLMMIGSTSAFAAIGCLPDQCGSSKPRPPLPPKCPDTAQTLKSVFAVEGCQTETVEDCSQCAPSATACLTNVNHAGKRTFTCVYCVGKE